MLLSEGQRSDDKGAALTLDALPRAPTLICDRDAAAGWFRQALAARRTEPASLRRQTGLRQSIHDAVLYRQRH